MWNFAANLAKILQRHFNCLTKHTGSTVHKRNSLSRIFTCLSAEHNFWSSFEPGSTVTLYFPSSVMIYANSPFDLTVLPINFKKFHRTVLQGDVLKRKGQSEGLLSISDRWTGLKLLHLIMISPKSRGHGSSHNPMTHSVTSCLNAPFCKLAKRVRTNTRFKMRKRWW